MIQWYFLLTLLASMATEEPQQPWPGVPFRTSAGDIVYIEVDSSILDLSKGDYDDLWEAFHDAGLERYFTEHAVAIVRNEHGTILGGITVTGLDELSIALFRDEQGYGIGTAMMKAYLDAGGTGYMVAGTEAGARFIASLRYNLNAEQRENLEIPSWSSIEDELEEFCSNEECYLMAEALVESEVGRMYGLSYQTGAYRHEGKLKDHAWTTMSDGTIVDTTYSQFDPKEPFLIAHPGSATARNYVRTEDMTEEELLETYGPP